MKRHIAAIAILLLMGSISWGQGAKEPFDMKKSKEELEIMKGILNTTLGFVTQEAQKQDFRGRFSNQNAFYLAGQGAVFVISTSELRFSGIPNLSSDFTWTSELSEEMSRLGEEISRYTKEIQAEAAQTARRALESSFRTGDQPAPPAPPVPPVPPVPVVPPTPPVPPAPPSVDSKHEITAKVKVEVDREKLRKAVLDAQAKVKKVKEDANVSREKFLQNLADIKVYLIEALANYGDSMTTVKPEEYLNLVLLSNALDGQRTRSDVISARKSWITDYKAGRLTLEGFKQKVIQYNQ